MARFVSYPSTMICHITKGTQDGHDHSALHTKPLLSSCRGRPPRTGGASRPSLRRYANDMYRESLSFTLLCTIFKNHGPPTRAFKHLEDLLFHQ